VQPPTTTCLLARWRRSLGARRRRVLSPRPLAALGYLANGPVTDGLIEIENLVLAVLYDEAQLDGRTAVWLAGFGGVLGPWGVRWGGLEQSRFLKDFSLRPDTRGRGPRPDARRGELLRLALQLDRKIERYLRYPRLTRRYRLRLPKLWAGFRASRVAQITGDGPELAEACRRSGKSADELLDESRRNHEGLTLFPLEWVSHHWEIASAVLADLERFPATQVFPLNCLPEGLQGFKGAAEYDFYTSRFRKSRDGGLRKEPQTAAVRIAG
jgi:hypothetical protein